MMDSKQLEQLNKLAREAGLMKAGLVVAPNEIHGVAYDFGGEIKVLISNSCPNKAARVLELVLSQMCGKPSGWIERLKRKWRVREEGASDSAILELRKCWSDLETAYQEQK